MPTEQLLLSFLSNLAMDVSSLLLSGITSTPTARASSSPTSLPNSKSSSVSTSSTSSVSSTAISSSLSTSSTSTSVESPPFLTPPPGPVTRTTVVVESSSISSAAPNVTGSNTSFLQNKVASGFVFAIVGIFGLVFIIFIATFFLRRRRNKKLIEDAVSFDPVIVGHDDMEKAEQSSSSGHGSHDLKPLPVYNQYSPPRGSPHQLYVPHARYGPPSLSPQRHLSFVSAMSSAEDTRPMSGEMRVPAGPVGGQVPEDIRRQYSTTH